MAQTAPRGRRSQRLPKIVVRASQQLGFMSPINSCDFADRFSDLESRLPISPSLLLFAPLLSFYPSVPALSFLTSAFRHSAGSSPPTRMNPSCGQFATYYQVKYRGRFVIAEGGYFAGDCEAYDSCACCSDKNRNLNVAGIPWVLYVLVNMKRQLMSRVLHTSFACTCVTSKFVKQEV